MTNRDSVWSDSMPREYDAGLGEALFRAPARWTAKTVAGLAPPRSRILELAAGSGIVTAELCATVDGQVTATDLNQSMVDYGNSQVPQALWLSADAQALPFDDSSYDVVVCQFGVMFLPDRPRAFQEVGRVLRPGGVYVFTTWAPVADNELTAVMTDALATLFGANAPTFVSRVPHGYHDEGLITSELRAGSLSPQRIERVVEQGSAESAAQVARGFCQGTPLRMGLQELGDLDEITERMAAEMTRRLGPGPVTGALTFLAVVAQVDAGAND
jgi:ubiquinone/menaquinone biosynthesis C-methylase UbiE